MKNNYNDCLTRLLKDEGGYINDPSDSGGPTNFGITLADYQKYINRSGTASDVKGMSIDDAKTIYKSKYWDALGCDTLTSGVDYTCFDYGVNSGLGRPRKALTKFKDKTGVELIDAINDERVDFLHSISGGKNSKFLKGWLARASRVRDYSKSLAKINNTAGPAAVAVTVGAAAGAQHYWQGHEILFIAGGLTAAILIGFLVHYIKNKGK